jgi:hypothetical protein
MLKIIDRDAPFPGLAGKSERALAKIKKVWNGLPQVAGEVSGFVGLGAPHVRRAVDKEGAVPYAHNAQRAAPNEGRPAAHLQKVNND